MTIDIGSIVPSSPAAPYWTPLQKVPAGTLLQVPEGKKAPKAFQPLTIRGITFQNRIFVPPMDQYSYQDGFMTDWTLVAIGSYAVRGAALSIIESTAVSPEGRISVQDAGLWKDEHIPPLKRVVDFVHSQNQKIGVQLNHSGRMGSTGAPWTGTSAETGGFDGVPLITISNGGFTPVGPSPVRYGANTATPRELTIPEIKQIIQNFQDAAVRAVKAGVDVIEIHAAHGYLIDQFLSPVANHRTDEYGGSFEGRIKFCVEVVKAIKAVIPDNVLLFIRISATDRLDYRNEGWTVKDSIELLKVIQPLGVDMVDVSTGGNSIEGKIEYGPAFQAKYAYEIKKAIPNLYVSSVGAIHNPETIDEVFSHGIDAVSVGRPFSHNPSFALDLATKYGVQVQWPVQIGYTRKHM